LAAAAATAAAAAAVSRPESNQRGRQLAGLCCLCRCQAGIFLLEGAVTLQEQDSNSSMLQSCHLLSMKCRKNGTAKAIPTRCCSTSPGPAGSSK
jgi:hypothetical protein